MTTASRRLRVIEAVVALERDDGTIDPEDVILAARDPASPLHHSFEWDLEVAAHERHLDVARTLIRTVRYEVTVRKTTINSVQYVHDVRLDQNPRSAGYVNIANVTEAGLTEATLEREFQHVAGVVERALGIAARLDQEPAFRERLRALLR
jgi:AraC-like DNA-binding protein